MGRKSGNYLAASSSRSHQKNYSYNSNSNKQGTLEQLESLRSFVPREMGFTESDLTACLRQCGFNTQLAAEHLITGEWAKQKNGGRTTFFKMTTTTTTTTTTPADTPSPRNHRPPSTHNSNHKTSGTKGKPTTDNLIHTTPALVSKRKDPPTYAPVGLIDLSTCSDNDDDDNNADDGSGHGHHVHSRKDHGEGQHDDTENRPNKAAVACAISRKDPPSTAAAAAAATAAVAVASSRAVGHAVRRKPVTTTTTLSHHHHHPHNQTSHGLSHGCWLLCQRWISDAVCTTRQGAMEHMEELETQPSGPAFLRLRGQALEGRFPDHIGRLLNPLLREGLVELQAHALMQERGLPMGASIPVSLSVYLPDPKRFFTVFATVDASLTSSSSSTQSFWQAKAATAASQRKGGAKHKASSLEQAAFDLLQWAQYGDVPEFAKGLGGKTSPAPDTEEEEKEETKDEEAENSDETDMKEEEFETATEESSTERAQEWSASVTATAAQTARIPESDTPEGFKDVCLRPYQKQALYWMRQREVTELNRQEQEEQLALLAELSRSQHQSSSILNPLSKNKDIVCECGPVQVSQQAAERAQTCDGVTNPLSHPLWQRRFLTDPSRKRLLCFFVNEFMGVASHLPADPPKVCSGGILADAMGLGKTVMLLSLILRGKQEAKEDSPSATLVVAKLSLLPQWEDEIRSKTNLSFAVYYGAQASREYTVQELESVDIVLTTYGTMQGELKRKNPLLTQARWLRVILDEAHCIRNESTLASKACCLLDAKHRWAVSGTIMMNSMQDLFGIFKFLRHEPWCLPPFWKAAISKPMQAYENAPGGEKEDQTDTLQIVLSRLRRVLAPLMLRRTRDSLTTDGKPILTLPPVESKVVFVELTPTERAFYQAVLARSLEAFTGFVDAGTAAKSYLQILSMISRLRQCCDHISLTVRSRLDEGECEEISGGRVEADEAEKGIKMKEENKSKLRKENAILSNQFMQGLMSKLLSPKRRKTNLAVDESPSPSKRPREQYLQSVASSLSNAVLTQSTHMSDECPICLDEIPIAAAVLTPCGHCFCRKCLVGYLHDRATPSQVKEDTCPDGSCPVCSNSVSASRIVAVRASREDPARYVSKYLTAPSPCATPVKAKTVRSDSPVSSEPSASSILQEAVDSRVDSSKMTAILLELKHVWKLDPGSKVLIFSQFLGFLDLLQSRLSSMGVPFWRLDGQMTLAKRVDVLKEFRAASRPSSYSNQGSVLLMSMNAGGEGLNLVAASTVFLADPWWNAAKEDQCINRVVRLGQTAPLCRVRKFVVRQSVEERIVELQTRKQYVADELYETVGRESGGAVGGSARLTLEDLQILFKS